MGNDFEMSDYDRSGPHLHQGDAPRRAVRAHAAARARASSFRRRSWPRSSSSSRASAPSCGAVGVVCAAQPVLLACSRSSSTCSSLAALFLLLQAQFVAAAQVVVYAGAVMVLYVFVVAYVGGGGARRAAPAGRRAASARSRSSSRWRCSSSWPIAVLGSALKALGTDGADLSAGFGTPEQIGELLLTKFLLPFEVASFLLLIAAVGAVVLAAPAPRRHPARRTAWRGHDLGARLHPPAGHRHDGRGRRHGRPALNESERAEPAPAESRSHPPEGGW